MRFTFIERNFKTYRYFQFRHTTPEKLLILSNSITFPVLTINTINFSFECLILSINRVK